MSELAPLPLKGVRIADLTWALASAGTSTLLASLGAEVIRIEWPERMDFTRLAETAGVGISSRELKRTPLAPGKKEVPYQKENGPALPAMANRSGVFNDRNPGKYGVTLNMALPEGREIFKRLVRTSDIVMDGFKAPVMGKWGLDYEGLRAEKDDIIYIQMSGYGNTGRYRSYGSLGPTAHAFSGLGFQGLPDPHEPTSWSHSYMDTTPPFYSALAAIGALHYRNRTGKGQYIDQAQYEPGLLIGGTGLLDFSANGRRTSRVGNRSPHLPASPHGIYRCEGDDAWIAIAVFDEREWLALCRCMGEPAWSKEARFSTLESRIRNQEALDALVGEWSATQERYALMYALQEAGVPAGVVQSPQDKVTVDPHLKVRDFFVHLDHSELGTRPFTRHLTAKLSQTPAHPGGLTHRGAPCLGEDNEYVYERILGMTPAERKAYEDRGVI
ncbi:CaiB/BaiF CoA transferase family protein [Ramlibacter sp.]|uniref:CaiB/BaiF CoA transferase family protein n=1 Tax=Ramlibacter sp. TaxID=1917967 RepID=UPI003D0F7D65